VLGILEDVSSVLKIAFRNPGDLILLLNGSHSAEGIGPAAFSREFSSSEYSKTIGGIVSGEPPEIDLAAEKRLIDGLVALASAGLLRSAHDISDGGLAVALAESCFACSSVGAQLGANVSVDDPDSGEYTLFSERGARAIVSVSPENLAAVLAIARQYGVAASEIGKVTHNDVFCIEHKGHAVVESPVALLCDAWANSLERAIRR